MRQCHIRGYLITRFLLNIIISLEWGINVFGVKKYLKFIRNPLKLIRPLGARGLLNWMSDELYLKIIYRAKTEKKLNLKNPRTYNEKLQWLKLFYRKPDYYQYVDKYEVRSYISETIGEEYLIPLIGVYNKVEDIKWETLPNKFVLKCTHGSGTNIICFNKDELDIKSTEIKLNNWMKKNWYGREWPYKNARPRIICEKYIKEDKDSNVELRDYRFFCFNGKPKFIAVDLSITNKKRTRRNLYDLEWNLMDGEITYPKELTIKIEKPSKLDQMIELSKNISKNFPHARIDFYQIKDKVIFGEITFYHQSGLGEFRPPEFEGEVGKYLKLPSKIVD